MTAPDTWKEVESVQNGVLQHGGGSGYLAILAPLVRQSDRHRIPGIFPEARYLGGARRDCVRPGWGLCLPIDLSTPVTPSKGSLGGWASKFGVYSGAGGAPRTFNLS